MKIFHIQMIQNPFTDTIDFLWLDTEHASWFTIAKDRHEDVSKIVDMILSGEIMREFGY